MVEVDEDSGDDSLPNIDYTSCDSIESVSNDFHLLKNESISDHRDNLSLDLKREINSSIETQQRYGLKPNEVLMPFQENFDENKQQTQSSCSSIDENHLYIYEDVVVCNPITNGEQIKSRSVNNTSMDNPPFDNVNSAEEKEKPSQTSGDEITSKLPEKAYRNMTNLTTLSNNQANDSKQSSKTAVSNGKTNTISYNDIPSANRIISALIDHAGVFVGNFSTELKALDFIKESRSNSRENLRKQAGDFLFSIKKSTLKSYEKNRADLIDPKCYKPDAANSLWPFQDNYDHVVDYISSSLFNKTLEMHSKWSKDEINNLKHLFQSHHKDFITLSNKIGTKTVDNIIEFYYKFRAYFAKPKSNQSNAKSEIELCQNTNAISSLHGDRKSPTLKDLKIENEDVLGSQPNYASQNLLKNQNNEQGNKIMEIDSNDSSHEKSAQSPNENGCDLQKKKSYRFVSKSYSPIINNSTESRNLTLTNWSSDSSQGLIRHYPPPMHHESRYSNGVSLAPYMEIPLSAEPPLFYHNNPNKNQLLEPGFNHGYIRNSKNGQERQPEFFYHEYNIPIPRPCTKQLYKSRFSYTDIPSNYNESNFFHASHSPSNGSRTKIPKYASKSQNFRNNGKLVPPTSFNSDHVYSVNNNALYSKYSHRSFYPDMEYDTYQSRFKMSEDFEPDVIYIDENCDREAEIEYSPMYRSDLSEENEPLPDLNINNEKVEGELSDNFDRFDYADDDQTDHFFLDKVSGNLYCNGTQLSFIPLMPQISLDIKDSSYSYRNSQVNMVNIEENNEDTSKYDNLPPDQIQFNGEPSEFTHQFSLQNADKEV
ncbi:MAG: hypothetical protein MHPSP_001505, partial [Paramarteilia canceri]